MGLFSSKEQTTEVQVQEEKLIQLHIAHILDLDKMIINKMEDYFLALESENLKNAQRALNAFVVISNNMISHLNKENYKKGVVAHVEALKEKCQELSKTVIETKHTNFVISNGLVPFENLLDAYIDILEGRDATMKVIEINEKTEAKIDIGAMNAIQGIFKILFEEQRKERKVEKGKITEIEKLCDWEKDQEYDKISSSLCWERYRCKRKGDLAPFFSNKA